MQPFTFVTSIVALPAFASIVVSTVVEGNQRTFTSLTFSLEPLINKGSFIVVITTMPSSFVTDIQAFTFNSFTFVKQMLFVVKTMNSVLQWFLLVFHFKLKV